MVVGLSSYCFAVYRMHITISALQSSLAECSLALSEVIAGHDDQARLTLLVTNTKTCH